MQLLSEILPFITALGLGGAIGVIVQHLLNRNAETKLKLKAINEEKYRTILIYMSIVINPLNKDHFILNDTILYGLKEDQAICSYATSKLKEYYYQSLLYASDEVMRAFKLFLLESNRQNYVLAAQKMRVDLWGNKTKLTASEIRI